MNKTLEIVAINKENKYKLFFDFEVIKYKTIKVGIQIIRKTYSPVSNFR